MIALTYEEKIELSYLRLKGFKYLVRNEIGSVKVYVRKPHRDKETNYTPFGKSRGGYDFWIETKTPMSLEEQKRFKSVELGSYSFISWKDEPMLIDDLLNTDEKTDEDFSNLKLQEKINSLFVTGWLPEIFKQYPTASSITLFGSRIKGTETDESDIDIMLNVSEEGFQTVEDYKELNEFFDVLLLHNIPLDVKANHSTDEYFVGKGYVEEIESIHDFFLEATDLEEFIIINKKLGWDFIRMADYEN